jgi:hypothetical protein
MRSVVTSGFYRAAIVPIVMQTTTQQRMRMAPLCRVKPSDDICGLSVKHNVLHNGRLAKRFSTG